MGQFLIVCHRLTDSTKNTINLVCELIQNYFKDIFIPYKTVILSSYNTKELLIHFATYNHSYIQLGQNGIIFGKMEYLRNKRIFCHYLKVIDLRKAFNSIDHLLLLAKLSGYGFDDIYINFFLKFSTPIYIYLLMTLQCMLLMLI